MLTCCFPPCAVAGSSSRLMVVVVVMDQCWADQAAASASAAQVPFLALLQGAAMGDGGPGVKRESYGAAAGFACRPAASDVDLLESCVTQLPAPPVVEAPATKRRKRPRTRPRAPPPEKRKKPEEAEHSRRRRRAPPWPPATPRLTDAPRGSATSFSTSSMSHEAPDALQHRHRRRPLRSAIETAGDLSSPPAPPRSRRGHL